MTLYPPLFSHPPALIKRQVFVSYHMVVIEPGMMSSQALSDTYDVIEDNSVERALTAMTLSTSCAEFGRIM